MGGRWTRREFVGSAVAGGGLAGTMSLGTIATRHVAAAPVRIQEQVTLRFATLSDPGEQGNVEKWLAEFNKEQPNVKVTVEPQSGDYGQKLTVQAASGTLPDLYWISDQMVPGFANQGLMLNLDESIQKSGLKLTDYYDSMIALGHSGDSQYMMPRDYNHLVAYYNLDMFKAAGLEPPKNGWTWDEFTTAVKALTKKEGDQTTQFGVDGSNFDWWAITVPAIRGFGGEVVDEAGKVVVNSPEAAKGIAALGDLMTGGFASGVKGTETENDTFLNGRAAIWLHVRPVAQAIVEASAGKFDWDAATFPAFPVQHRVGTGTSGYAISARTQHPDEAWTLLSFIVSAKGQEIFSSTGNAVPVLKSLNEEGVWRDAPEGLENDDAFVLYPEADTLPLETRMPPGAGGQVDTSRIDLWQRMALGEVDATQFVEEWAGQIEQAIADNA